MKHTERKEFLDDLVNNYIYQKEHDKIFERECSRDYAMALGRLLGACLALNLIFNETEECLTISTSIKKKIIINLIKENK